jgi:phenylacetate-CoA ligase
MKLAISPKNVWERLPYPAKKVLGAVLGTVPPAYLLGKRFRDTLRFLQASDQWSLEQIREYQLRQLRSICTLAYERTAYYRRTFDQAGFHPNDLKTIEDVGKLPTISRATLSEHLDEMCAVSVHSPKVDYVSTGGTSGNPLHFYIGADRSAIEYAYIVSGWKRAGFQLGDELAVFRGRKVRADGSGLRHEYDAVLHQHYYSNFHMTDRSMAAYLRHLSTIGPCYLHAYPSSVAALAQFLRRSGVAAPRNVRGILAESEIVYPGQRKAVEETFQCRYLSSYGHTEKTVAAAECEHSTNYHVWPTYGYFELLDKDGVAVTRAGETGEIVGTGFINRVVPFIRYRTGDYATYETARCAACGRNHTVISNIAGHRVQEFLVGRDGNLISWTAMNVHDATFDCVRQMQFRQETPGRASLQLVPGAEFRRSDLVAICNAIEERVDRQLSIQIIVVDEIPLSASGKAIYVDQRIEGVKGEADFGAAHAAGESNLYAVAYATRRSGG